MEIRVGTGGEGEEEVGGKGGWDGHGVGEGSWEE